MPTIITNPGQNLDDKEIERYGIVSSPQRIMVDGEAYDTRAGIPLSQVDEWCQTAKSWPEVIGTRADEMAQIYKKLIDSGEREILSIQTSRKIIQSYTAAVSARRTMESLDALKGCRIEVFDTGVTDYAAGMSVILAAESFLAGRSMDETLATLEQFKAGVVAMYLLFSLDYAAKGGRVSFLKRWVAERLAVRPVLSMVDGQVVSSATFKASSEIADVTVENLKKHVEPGRRVWAAVLHGDDVGRAMLVRRAIERHWRLDYVVVRPLTSSIYLHAGKKSVGAIIAPVDDLDWVPDLSAYSEG